MKSMKFAVPRGTKDILPKEVSLWQHIEKTARKTFDLFCYEEIRTPMFEATGLFERGIGGDTDIVEKEMYTFEDKGGRMLTLRPEGTAPVVRSCIQHNLTKKVASLKLFYSGPMFRYERPQAGRYRQFHQMGVECLGNNHPMADVEVISLGYRLFTKLGLNNLKVKLNSVGCPVCRIVIEERLKQFIGSNLEHLCDNCKRRFNTKPLRILDCKNKGCTTYYTGLPNIFESQCRECKDHFSQVVEHLSALNIPFEIDHKLVRGLDYYTKTTFEILSDQLGAQNAVCGGGRYDGLFKQMGDVDTPAVGFAFGMERTVMLLQEIETAAALKQSIDLTIISIGKETKSYCYKLLDQLREIGIKTSMNFLKDDLKPQLKAADKANSRLVLIVGEDEINQDKFELKNLSTREQFSVKSDELIDHLKKHLKNNKSQLQ
jgi:histidyl-tRNA synthetase